MRKMLALSVHQPWASWIADRYKTIETRDWSWLPKHIVGKRLAIQATKRPVSPNAPCRPGGYPLGAVVCHGRVAKVEFLHGGREQRREAMCECAGMVGIFLEDIVPLDPPIPCRGHQGFFTVEIPDADTAMV